ncbi:arylformamidase [Schlegelella sp. S2-27]|uniref:Kynurenine formamidase n=1 Tax=Caldimonas mangrovi TaxID=2944811 RepID=A0ABT0YHY8_9BURK|nr:arylformamidase [Caldimonas mangrovi]MCM5678004.1 arylformamidase [Caldimonas mangrovi]
MKRLWDISPPLFNGSPVFPGDTPYRQRWAASIGPGCPVNVSEITLSPHAGAHADAPLHYADGAATIGDVPLDAFLGPCRVVHCIGVGPLVQPEHLARVESGLPARVLVRTNQRSVVDRWVDDFSAFAPQTLAWLAQRGVRLVGIDTASVDPAASKTLDAHQVLLKHDLRVLENLVLDEVPEGDYELIALPLRLVQADASPVRAVLREL